MCDVYIRAHASCSILVDDDQHRCTSERCSINISISSRSQQAHAHAQHAVTTTGARCSPVLGSFSHHQTQSTSHIAAMTSLRAGAMICQRPDNGRDVEQWPRRHRQLGAASITSTLTIVMLIVFITCDTGQPPFTFPDARRPHYDCAFSNAI